MKLNVTVGKHVGISREVFISHRPLTDGLSLHKRWGEMSGTAAVTTTATKTGGDAGGAAVCAGTVATPWQTAAATAQALPLQPLRLHLRLRAHHGGGADDGGGGDLTFVAGGGPCGTLAALQRGGTAFQGPKCCARRTLCVQASLRWPSFQQETPVYCVPL